LSTSSNCSDETIRYGKTEIKMKCGIKHKITEEKGASAVEFAIILPLLVVFLFGIIEFGIIFYDKAMITNASREGARKGIVFRDPRLSVSEIQSVVDNYSSGKMITFGSSAAPVTTVPNGACVNHNDQLTVNVTYQYDFLLIPNFLGGALPNSITLEAQTEMRCE
jgi:Flp pilus assembly protein TadG